MTFLEMFTILTFSFYTSSSWNKTFTYYAKLFADNVAALSRNF